MATFVLRQHVASSATHSLVFVWSPTVMDTSEETVTRSDGQRFFKKAFGGVVLQNATRPNFSAGRILARRLGRPLTREQALEIPYPFAVKLKAKGKPLDIAHTDAICGEVTDDSFDETTATLTIQGSLYADRPEGRDALGFVEVGMDGLSLTTTEIFDAFNVYDIYVERVALCPLGAREGTTIRQHNASAFKTKDYKLDAQSVPSSGNAQHSGDGKQRLTIRRTYAMMNMARTEASSGGSSGAAGSRAWQLVDAQFDPPVYEQDQRLVMSTKTEASAGANASGTPPPPPPPAPVQVPSAGTSAPSPLSAPSSGASAPAATPSTSSLAPPSAPDAAMPPAAPLVPDVPAPAAQTDAEFAYPPYVRAMKAELEQQKAELQRLRARANEERRVNHDDTTSRPAPMNTAPTPSPAPAALKYPAPNALPPGTPGSNAPAQNYGASGSAPPLRSEYDAPQPFGHYPPYQHPYAQPPYHPPYHHVPYGQHYPPMPPPPVHHHAPYPDLNPYAADVRGYPSRAPSGAYPSPYHHPHPHHHHQAPQQTPAPVIPQAPAPQVPTSAPRGSRKRDGTGAGINAGEGNYTPPQPPVAASTASASAGADGGEGKTREQLASELQKEKTRSEALAKVGKEAVQYQKALASEFKKILLNIKGSMPQAEFSKFAKDAKLLKTVASALYTSSEKGTRTLSSKEVSDAIRRARLDASDDQDDDDEDDDATSKSRRYKKSATQASKNSDELLALAESLDVVDDAQLAKAKADYCQYSKWAVFKMGTMAAKRFASHVDEHGTYVPISVELANMRTAFDKTGLAFPLTYGFGAHQMQDAGLGGMEF